MTRANQKKSQKPKQKPLPPKIDEGRREKNLKEIKNLMNMNRGGLI